MQFSQNFVLQLEEDLNKSKQPPTWLEFLEFRNKVIHETKDDWYDRFGTAENCMLGRNRFLFCCQIFLVWLLGRDAYGEYLEGAYATPPADIWIVYCRLFCAVVLHMTL